MSQPHEFRLTGLSGNGSKVFLCLQCSLAVSTSDRIIEIDGRRRHRFVNPMGIPFDFMTFMSCPGAAPVGPPTAEHTWFPGYAWRLALCHGCGSHLGWHYSREVPTQGPSEFWGILTAHVLSKP